ncbi:hypothetical protein ACFQZC_38680 [Streptacidiphilus monticola]
MTEEACPCPKAPCGLVDEPSADPDCRQHHPKYARTMRQAHHPDRCPGPHPATSEAAQPEQPSEPAPDPEPEAWHTGRGEHGDVWIEDLCRCKKEPCGLVDPTRADPHCEHHAPGAARTMRQGHPASQCPGHRPHPRAITRAQQAKYIREQLADQCRQEERLARRLAEARAVRAATEDWLYQALMEPETTSGPIVPTHVALEFAHRFGRHGALFNLPPFLSESERGALAEVLDALGAHGTAQAWRDSAPPTEDD